MELFSRRRWTTGLVQQSNMYVLLTCICCIFLGGLTLTQQHSAWADPAFISFYKSSLSPPFQLAGKLRLVLSPSILRTFCRWPPPTSSTPAWSSSALLLITWSPRGCQSMSWCCYLTSARLLADLRGVLNWSCIVVNCSCEVVNWSCEVVDWSCQVVNRCCEVVVVCVFSYYCVVNLCCFVACFVLLLSWHEIYVVVMKGCCCYFFVKISCWVVEMTSLGVMHSSSIQISFSLGLNESMFSAM